MRAPGSLLHRQDELALSGAYKKGGLNVTRHTEPAQNAAFWSRAFIAALRRVAAHLSTAWRHRDGWGAPVSRKEKRQMYIIGKCVLNG